MGMTNSIFMDRGSSRAAAAASAVSFASMALFDTSIPQGRLLVTMLAAIAEFERELIHERTGAGRQRARAAGIRFGRKPKLSDFQR
jgi:DNA invertase Pin-like site-specific DNA recombinase